MGFFSKNKEQNATMEYRLHLEDPIKFKKQNNKKIDSFLDDIERDIKAIKTYPFATPYISEIQNKNIKDTETIYSVTGSRDYAMSLAYFNECQQWITLYFMNTAEGKLPDQRLTIMADLLYIYDFMCLTTINHFNIDRKEPMRWKDNCFYTRPDTQGEHIIRYVEQSIDNISNLIEAIDKCDAQLAYKTYIDIQQNQMLHTSQDPFAELN